MQTSSSCFSVEQVELIRRLRNSGISCQQLIEAFQSLERIDARFGNIYNSPVPSSNLQHARSGPGHGKLPQSVSLPAPMSHMNPGVQTLTNGPSSPRASISDSQHSLQFIPALRTPVITGIGSRSTVVSPGSQNFSHRTSDLLPQGNFTLATSSLADALRDVPSKSYAALHNGHSESLMSDSDQNHLAQNLQNGPGVGSGHTRSQAADLTKDQCLLLLQCSGDDKVIDFVKKCLLSTDFKPVQTAQELGVSEFAMQSFLWGDVSSVEQPARQKLLEWVIGMCHHTEWFTLEMAKLLHLQGCGDGFDVQFTPRRERFTFRERHLDVLEAFWRKKQYPTFEEKELIADECNYAMAVEVQRELEEKEKVTHVNVANWFKNKRKEIKRVIRKGDNTETVKTFLDRLNPKIASTTAAGVNGPQGDTTVGEQGLYLDHAERFSLSSSIEEGNMLELPLNPDSSSGTNTSGGATSLLTKSDLIANTASMPIVFPNFSSLDVSYSMGRDASSLQALGSVHADGDLPDPNSKGKEADQNSSALASQSPDSSSTTNSVKTTEPIPTTASTLSICTNTDTTASSDGGILNTSGPAGGNTALTSQAFNVKQELRQTGD